MEPLSLSEAERTELSGGVVRVRFACGNPDFAVSRILAAKGAISVHSGQRLMDRLRDELAAVASWYQDTEEQSHA